MKHSTVAELKWAMPQNEWLGVRAQWNKQPWAVSCALLTALCTERVLLPLERQKEGLGLAVLRGRGRASPVDGALREGGTILVDSSAGT